jgi:hypothetical protein
MGGLLIGLLSPAYRKGTIGSVLTGSASLGRRFWLER